MNNKIIGIVLIVIGVALALWGYDLFNSASSQIISAFSGDTPIEAWLGMVGGVICAAIGISKIR
jgi:drug/metabolite transporter (DMT)-like permease